MKYSFNNLGALPTPRDLRDLHLGAVQPATEYPKVFMQDVAWQLPIFHQRKQPACGAHAGAFLKQLLDSYESKGRKYTPRFTWIDLKSFDGHPISVGTDLRSIFKSLSKSGALDFDLLGNDSTLSEADYASQVAATPPMYENAQPHIIGPYAFETSITFESLKRAIYNNKGVIVRMEVGDSWWTNQKGIGSWAEKDILPLRPPTDVVSGHFVCLHSYDENNIYFANSWSTDWGRKGHGYFGNDYIKWVTDAGTAVDVPDELITKTVKLRSLLKNLLAYLQKKLA